MAASAKLRGPRFRYRGSRRALVESVRDALYAAKICSYAQGFSLMRLASEEYDYNLDFGEIPASITP